MLSRHIASINRFITISYLILVFHLSVSITVESTYTFECFDHLLSSGCEAVLGFELTFGKVCDSTNEGEKLMILRCKCGAWPCYCEILMF